MFLSKGGIKGSRDWVVMMRVRKGSVCWTPSYASREGAEGSHGGGGGSSGRIALGSKVGWVGTERGQEGGFPRS